MAKIAKIQRIPLSQISINMLHNPRERVEAAYDDPQMRDSLAMSGQLTIAKVVKIGPDQYEPLQGNRRVFNLKKLAEAGIVDPKTAKRAEDGSLLRDPNTNLPVGGKVFDSLEAEVYENLTPRERVELNIDHGSIRSLNKVELQYAFESMFEVGYSEKEAVIQLGSLLRQHYPPSRSIKPEAEDGGTDLLNYYRGVAQTAKDAWRCPDMLHDAWINKLQNGKAWPLKSEMTQGYDVYKKEQDSDKSGLISRKAPGPKFLEFWKRITEKQQKAEETGAKRGKAVSMMNHNQLTDKVMDSRVLRAMRYIVLRTIPEDQLPVLDKAMVEMEAGNFTKEQLTEVLNSIFATLEVTEEVKVEAPQA